MRVVALDLGSRRIGVAISDPTGTIASPHSVIERADDVAVDHAAIAALVAEVEAERVVVGLPISMGGAMGAAARAASAEAEALATVLSVPVETYDERLTTVAADRLLLAGRVKGGARRRVVDKIAAAVILQGWLGSQHR
ncbi:MAG TPA: Holliday junction resolvase RuvX [Acidimicrobiales bacterium]|nr:Holliday junction resolvase RuvX [Acidimicrobiales bacterium]